MEETTNPHTDPLIDHDPTELVTEAEAAQVKEIADVVRKRYGVAVQLTCGSTECGMAWFAVELVFAPQVLLSLTKNGRDWIIERPDQPFRICRNLTNYLVELTDDAPDEVPGAIVRPCANRVVH